MNVMPIFLISYNRADVLTQAIAGLQHLKTPIDIVIHDNGSNDEYTLSTLDELERSGVRIYRSHALNHPDELNNVQNSIASYFGGSVASSEYVVSDCDIDLSSAEDDAIEVYRELLYIDDNVRCCGPMLRISDIPKEYPLYNHVMNRHIEQFWKKVPTIIDLNGRKVGVQVAFIDTTFAVHRKNEPFSRLKLGLRVYKPYEALHLDWYISNSKDQYHINSNSNIAHWNNHDWFEKHQNVELTYSEYNTIDFDDDGNLCVVKRII